MKLKVTHVKVGLHWCTAAILARCHYWHVTSDLYGC